jgi:inhibitor of cysteine peptidase
MQVDRSYNGREVTLAMGDVMEITLEENPSTGYRWDLKVKPEPACSQVKNWFKATGGPPGSGGTHHWQFQAVRPGAAEINLEYRRPWEKDTPPRETFKLRVQVRKDSATPGSARSE